MLDTACVGKYLHELKEIGRVTVAYIWSLPRVEGCEGGRDKRTAYQSLLWVVSD